MKYATLEQIKAALQESFANIKSWVDGKRFLQEPTVEGGNGQVLTTDGAGGRWWRTVRDGIDGRDGRDGINGTNGTDGVSPTVSTSKVGSTATVVITDRQGARTFTLTDGEDGQDGTDGEDGVSPGVAIVSITGGHTVTITDKDHPSGQSFNVMDGETGATGATGPQGEKGDKGDTGAQGQPGTDGTDGEDGADATINGVTALTVDTGNALVGTQSGSTYSIDLSDASKASLAKADSALQEHQSLADYSTTAQMNTEIAAHHDSTKQDVIDESHKLPASNVSGLADVATSGSYNDLSNKPTIPTVTGKADKVSGATGGNFAGLNGNGNLTDSGKKASDFLTEHQSLAAYRTAAQQDAIHDSTKQDVISDLSDIRSGAALGATSVQPSDYSPDAKTSAMTQSVGKDANGKLWTEPGGGGEEFGNYELIESVTLTEDVSFFYRNKDTNNVAYNFKALHLFLKNASGNSGTIYVEHGAEHRWTNMFCFLNGVGNWSSTADLICLGGKIIANGYNGLPSAAVVSDTMQHSSPITQIGLSGNLKTGTQIKIYGVRA